jgi:hypothetical protein
MTCHSLWPTKYTDTSTFQAGPDKQLLAWMYCKWSGVGMVQPSNNEPLSGWTNLSYQFDCPAWQKHKFEQGNFFISNLHKGIDVHGSELLTGSSQVYLLSIICPVWSMIFYDFYDFFLYIFLFYFNYFSFIYTLFVHIT